MRCMLKNEIMFRHALSVRALMVSLACKLKLPAKDIYECGLAGLLLDIGVNAAIAIVAQCPPSKALPTRFRILPVSPCGAFTRAWGLAALEQVTRAAACAIPVFTHADPALDP